MGDSVVADGLAIVLGVVDVGGEVPLWSAYLGLGLKMPARARVTM
jgi:hypothetical protein